MTQEGYEFRERIYLHALREIAFRINDETLSQLIPPVQRMLIAIREDGHTNGISAFCEGGEQLD